MTIWQTWLWSAGMIAIAVIAALVVHRVAFAILHRLTRSTALQWDAAVVRRARGPARLALTLFAVLFVLPNVPVDPIAHAAIQRLITIALIGCIAWAVIALVDVIDDVMRARFRTDVPDNLDARRIATQVQVLRRVVVVLVTIVAIGVALMTFPTIRQIGTSMLASAGLAGLVVGIAMRPTLSNLLAGVQIALTQPIRLHDSVIVEGEWGWIEEITTTYVVVKVWDLRRLVLPLTYFVEKPFQNWTRTTATLLGSVYVYVDYRASVDDLRAELQRIVKTTDLWLGQVCTLQVTDVREQTIQLRALVDARDAGAAWDLRCLIREKLIAYLQRTPGMLPRARVVLEGDGAPPVTRAGMS